MSRRPVGNDMARRRRARNYKLVNINSVDMGSAGEPVQIGYITKLDAEGVTAFCKNLVVSSYVADYKQPAGSVAGNVNPVPSIMYYVTTSSTFDGDDVITARATSGAGTVNLALYRRIMQNTDVDDGNFGKLHLFAELTDITVSANITVKYCIETWGRFVKFTET